LFICIKIDFDLRRGRGWGSNSIPQLVKIKKICLGILLSGKNFYHIFFSNNINNNVDLVRGLLQNSEFSASVAQQKFQLSPFPSFFFSFSFAFKRFLKTGKGKKYISPF